MASFSLQKSISHFPLVGSDVTARFYLFVGYFVVGPNGIPLISSLKSQKMTANTEKDIDTVSAKVDTIEMPEQVTVTVETSPAEESFAPESETADQGEELTDSAVAAPPETSNNETFCNGIPETPEASENELLLHLKSATDANGELLQQLAKDFDVKLKYDAAKQEQIDKLYGENQEYKQGILEKFKKSLVLAVIGQIDAAVKTISHFGNQEFSEENYRKLLGNYREIATDFQDSLAQSFDVVAFDSEENTPFDAKRQRALKTVPTEDETKHKTISKSLRQGYEMANADGTTTLLRLEMVEVYVHQAPQS